MTERVSQARLAEIVGVGVSTVRYHVQIGNLRLGDDGKLLVSDADFLRRIKAGQSKARDPAAGRLFDARAEAAGVKVQRLDATLGDLEDRLLERDPLVAEALERAQAVRRRLMSWPERCGPALAEATGLDLEDAREVVRRTVTAALDELGDLEAEAETACRNL